MAPAIETSLKPPARRRRSFHRRYRKLILVARILLGAAIAVGVVAIPHFAYNAFNTANCYHDGVDEWGNPQQVAVQSDECRAVFMSSDDHLRLDASVALLGVALVLNSVVCYRKARRYRPRAPIRPPRQH